ncbi:hypothetical protein MKX01_041416 [Papaver californicum]|nr:hypothetical protein MKX01_041416 [Papaver californicum]
MANHPSLVPEIGPDGIARESPVIAYREKIIAAEQLSLQKYIEENYSKIRDVERELSNLNLELKLTAGPKKAALGHMRKKIEVATEKICLAKIKEEQAKKAWEEASEVVKDEEAIKQKLCDDLNNLVQESSQSQYTKLEELKRRLEALNPGRDSTTGLHDVKSPQSSTPAPDVSSNSHGTTPASQTAGNSHDQGNAPIVNGQGQQPSVEGEGRAKKKIINPGRGKSGFVPKGRGSPGPGWTGAGFDVDARS